MSRNEIDGRQYRCDQARLRPANVPNVAPLGAESLKALSEIVGEVEPQIRLLSFDEAHKAGLAMHDRWLAVGAGVPPLSRDDAAWADMARAAWEAVWAARAR